MTNQTSQSTEAPGPSSEGSGASACTKCQVNPRAARGSWCQECRREAQRAYNQRTRARPEMKSAPCTVCGTEMQWLSGKGPDRVYCSRICKSKVDQALRVERQRSKNPALLERQGMYQQGFRRCNACDFIKPLSDFYARGAGWQHRCKKCTKEKIGDSATAIRRRSWISHLKTTFKMSLDQFDELLISQDGRCYLCWEPLVEPHVDHDHSCCPGRGSCGNCVRGLACGPCNNGIGFFRDDPALMCLTADRLEQRMREMRTS